GAEDGQIVQGASTASKAGIVGLTLTVARDLSSEAIRVNTILPGIFDTPLLQRAPDRVKEALAAQVPFPARLGQPEEYAQLAYTMITNGYFNGKDVRLDGAIRMTPRGSPNRGDDLRAKDRDMVEALIIDACRTPRGVGKAGKGALSDIHPQHLGATVLSALRERTGIDTAEVDDIIWGTSAQVGDQTGDIGRMSALDAGYDVRASGVTLDRFCGSGITSVNMAAASIMSGAEDLVIAGGTEKMSMATRRGDGPLMMDSGNLRLRARHPQSHQGVCADAIATLEGISREDTDQLSLVSQQRAAAAIANGHFSKSLVPVFHEDGRLALDKEEYPRPQTTLEGLAALKTGFPAVADYPLDDKGTTYRRLILQKYPDLEIDHIHHAGNSSGFVDGS